MKKITENLANKLRDYIKKSRWDVAKKNNHNTYNTNHNFYECSDCDCYDKNDGINLDSEGYYFTFEGNDYVLCENCGYELGRNFIEDEMDIILNLR
jgi:hypothetical protein